MQLVSVIMPIYNVERYVAEAIRSVLQQTYSHFELIIVDDGGQDRSLEICQSFSDERIRIVRQPNRGLAGARNTGIRHAQGELIGLLDSDDAWAPGKLAAHVQHFTAAPEVGVSYAATAFIDEESKPLGYYQRPKLRDITAVDVLCRNPIGNGSAPVLRRQVFQDICFRANLHGVEEDFFFDDQFRQSEDIECWIRIALTTSWRFEGLPEVLTLYRVNTGGLSASVSKQLAAWERVIAKAQRYAPEFIAQWGSLARGYQLRYLARRAVRLQDGALARQLIHQALSTDLRILSQEPQRTLTTVAAAYLLSLLPRQLYEALERLAIGQVPAPKDP